MKLNFTGDVHKVTEGIHLLTEELQIEVADDGYPIHIKKTEGPIVVSNANGQGTIQYEEPIHFFRALGLWLENYQKTIEFSLIETHQFSMSGAMLDVSRNAVLTIEGVHDLLRKMALMGLNVMMLYTEDTYEVQEYPYFGYMRGRYTEEELEVCDDYAHSLGIEMIPCIQTLAHLTEALKWNYAATIRDTADILLVGNPRTYEFIENLIKAASKPFRSKRIHIGMDEAHHLGLGKYLDKNGYEERFSIMNRHLEEVVAITEKHGLNPMIWSDMYFRIGSKHGGYYDLDANIPQKVIDSIPDTQLVYWDYYHADEEFYRTFLQKHKELGSDPIFAGGVWTWNGISPNYGKAMRTTEAALTACKKEKIKEVFATMWGDNGAETPQYSALPILQYFAEHSYHGKVSEAQLKERFYFCTGGHFDDFMLLNQLDETPGVSKDNLHESNPSKFLLWQDILIGLYDENVRGLPLNEHYESLVPKLKEGKRNNKEWESIFDFYMQLAQVLSVKAELGLTLKALYDNRDREEMKEQLSVLSTMKDDVELLRIKHRDLWFMTNKPFGWEVIDLRYGGLLTRIETADFRIRQWITGEIETIEELDVERLYFEGPYKMPKGSIGRNIYSRMVTASTLT